VSRWLNREAIGVLSISIGMDDDEAAAELGVPLWQLQDGNLQALPHANGGWETTHTINTMPRLFGGKNRRK
jgi:hypothetical protein